MSIIRYMAPFAACVLINTEVTGGGEPAKMTHQQPHDHRGSPTEPVARLSASRGVSGTTVTVSDGSQALVGRDGAPFESQKP
jgi:hypothetical protein